jgi:hypothetical protein
MANEKSSILSTSFGSRFILIAAGVLEFKGTNGGREILVTIVRGLFTTGTDADLYIWSSRMSSVFCEVTDSHSVSVSASFWASVSLETVHKN